MAKKKDTSPYHGFVVEFEPERSNRMTEWLSAGYDVSDSFSSDDWGLRKKEIFFLLAPRTDQQVPTLFGAAYVERMHGTGGTRKPKYRLTKPVLFEGPIDFDELARVSTDLANSISNPSRGLRLTPALWLQLVTVVLALRPAQAEELQALLALVQRDTQLLGGTNRLDRLAEQRDAVGIVLDVAGLDRTGVLKGVDADKADEADVFFDLLTAYPYQERSLIEHDVHWLQQLLEDSHQERVFMEPGAAAKVTVRITDKEPLETALGVDLLIYQSLYNSLIFVQYKGMAKEGEDGWLYRPDHQLDMQLQAMRLARVAMRKRGTPVTRLADIRLNDEPFYFKLCERRKPEAAEASLVPGMSINSLHFEDFLKMPQAKGPRGGLQIGYKNCHRYFNNTEFVALAKGGWIGTSAAGSEFMKEVVAASLERKHALVYALIEVPEQGTAQLRKARK